MEVFANEKAQFQNSQCNLTYSLYHAHIDKYIANA